MGLRQIDVDRTIRAQIDVLGEILANLLRDLLGLLHLDGDLLVVDQDRELIDLLPPDLVNDDFLRLQDDVRSPLRKAPDKVVVPGEPEAKVELEVLYYAQIKR